jgi:proteic killer suppression protein
MGYIFVYDCSIKHKGLKLLWEKNDATKLPPQQVLKIKIILEVLNRAKKVNDIAFPGSDFHSLKGELEGYWAVKVTGNYRIVFLFIEENALDIDYLDYH